jgi:hypothetical protein
MGTVNATLLSAVPITTWVNATFSWVTAKGSIQPSPAPGRRVSSFLAARGESPASRGVLFLTRPERVGGNEVKQ